MSAPLYLPLEYVPAHGIPCRPVRKTDGVGSGEELLRYEQLGRLAVVSADLVDSQSNRLVLACVLALDHENRNAVDEKDDILPRAVMAVMICPLFGNLVHISRRIVVIDQNQIALALLLMIEKLAPVAQILHEFPVAVNVGMKMPELPQQRPLRLRITRIELANLRVEQIVEEEG